MRVAASNIAWPRGADAEAADVLAGCGAEGVELALTKVWPEPLAASAADARACRAFWEGRGLPVVALQALLFGKPELCVFGPPDVRRRTADYLAGIIERAGWLGAGALVFGSPKNRRRGGLGPDEAGAIAVPFFRELGQVARRHGTCLCIEPNPPQYGCDFVTTAAEAVALVDAVADEGFGLHLDTAAMTLSGEGPGAVAAAAGRCRHFHASAPFLAEVGSGDVPHADFARALRERGYAGWVSLEMAEPEGAAPWRDRLGRALAFVRAAY